jgi:5,10-methylene-tetrahydrofolate dehydrogenase/methenyl tetrahydrofolate cyclohydrolase
VNGKVETKNTAKDGDMIMRADTSARERFFLPQEKFQRLYDQTPVPFDDHADAAELKAEGFKAFVPLGRILALHVDAELLAKYFPQGKCIAAWGSEMLVEEGDMVCAPLSPENRASKSIGEVYRIEKGVFAQTYVRDEAELIDGKDISAKVRADVKAAADKLLLEHGVKPGLAVILVGERKDSQSYVRNKKKAAAEVDFHTVDVDLPDTVSQEDLLKEVEKLNVDPSVHGILVQLPLPSHIDEPTILKAIKVEKDADGFSALNIGNLCLKGGDPPLAIPCTPAGCIEMLQRSDIDMSGKKAVVIGRSNIVGMPVAALLQSCDATVTVCHSRTKNMEDIVRTADIVVAAIGKAFYVKGSWLKPGCVVIDVGINAVDDASKKAGYRLVGDVDFEEAKFVASKITPVPGGVGPMTIAMLLKNTLNLARHSVELQRIPLRQTSNASKE